MIPRDTDFKRVITTLHHQEPDRVPLAEATIDYEIMSRFLGRQVASTDLAAQVDFWSQAGYDFIPLTVGMMEPGKVTQDSRISQVISEVMLRDTADHVQTDSWNLERRAWIHTRDDVERFPWDEAARLDLSKFRSVQALLPDGMKIIALSGKIFTLAWLLMGFEDFAANTILDPELVSLLVSKVAAIQLAGLREVVQIPNVAAVWAVDDMAFGSGPMLRPAAFRRFIFPWYEEFSSICHQHNKYLFFHTDGIVWDLLPDLIHLGIDALHPIDPTCMDIEEAKAKVGDKLCLMGNVSNELLMNGTPEEVIALTKRRLKVLGPGGGYCLGAGNSVPEWARIENYRAMIETGLRFGHYPIQTD